MKSILIKIGLLIFIPMIVFADWRINCNVIPTVYSDYQNYKMNLHRIDLRWDVPSECGYVLYSGPGAAYYIDSLDVQSASRVSVFVPAGSHWFFCVVPYDSDGVRENFVATFDTLVPSNVELKWKYVNYENGFVNLSFSRSEKNYLADVSIIEVDTACTQFFSVMTLDSILSIPIKSNFDVRVNVSIVDQFAAGLDTVLKIMDIIEMESPVNLRIKK